MMQFLKVVRANYANFNGRARRKEYWMYTLYVLILGLILSVIDNFAGLVVAGQGLLSSIVSLALILPGLAVAVRRLHDTGRSGWNYLWLLSGLGIFYVLYLLILEGDNGGNAYGANPKAEAYNNLFSKQGSVPFPSHNPFDNSASR